MLTKVFSHLGSFASLLALGFIGWTKGDKLIWWQILAFGVLLLITFYALYKEHKSAPKIFKGKNKNINIKKYMYNWIKNGERVAIFSRDLTWVDTNSATYNMLVQKSSVDELSICLPEITSMGKELKSKGAEIHEYPGLQLTPQSRFTITHLGKNGSRVAIAFPKGDKHKIYEYDQDHPAFSLANDIVEILSKVEKNYVKKP